MCMWGVYVYVGGVCTVCGVGWITWYVWGGVYVQCGMWCVCVRGV